MRTCLLRSSTAWEEVAIVIAMEGDIQHIGITVECLLGAIAVVNIL